MIDRTTRIHVLGFFVLVIACGPAEPGADGGTPGLDAGACTSAADCDDGRFCNGPERCLPGDPAADARGCVPDPPCEETQRCLEDEDRCATSCAIAPDADGDGAEAIACGGIDCDDADPDVHPAATEVCDGADRDEDCDPATFGDRDVDGDGFVDATCCNGEGASRRCGDDCGDHRRDAHPGNTEACEGIDNDCDGAIDEGLLVTLYLDADFDLHGTAGESMSLCPGTPGWSSVMDDCDDTSPVRHAAQLEICDAVDNDCDGLTDEAPVAVPWYPDEDGDLFGAPPDDPADVVVSCMPIAGRSTRSSDCDDGDAMIHPGAREICNGEDDDCNGRADAPALPGGDREDDDGDGSPDASCGGGDCDDGDDTIYPRAPELCDGADNDCDGVVDGADAMATWYADADRDGYGDSAAGSPPPIVDCDPQPGRVPRGGDCDDDDASVHPRAPDRCDGVDADCDGTIDEGGIRFAFFPDADADGWGTSDLSAIVFRCTAPAGTASRAGDCRDTDADVRPDALETCDGADEDCDGTIDEDSDRSWYLDVDGDGHGRGTPVLACTAPAGRAALDDDCDDGDAGRYPGHAELCNGIDDDCDTMIDDGASAACTGLDHATASCSGGCVLTCVAGYRDCDGVADTGCETYVDRSPSACGSCTTRCNAGDSCGTTTPGTCDRSPVVSLAAGEGYVLALRASGGVAGWGEGTSGQTTFGGDQARALGLGLTGIAEIEPGPGFACARTTGGRVLCWGNNASGQLGDGSFVSRPGPREVPGLVSVRDVDVGGQHACAVRTDGSVACWGIGGFGQIGMIGTAPSPVEVPSITSAVEVLTGARHTCVRRGAAGAYEILCFGNGEVGQLGDGSIVTTQETPVTVVGLPSDVAGFAHGTGAHDSTCVRTGDGRVFCWGDNSSGYGLGLGPGQPTTIPTPAQMPGMTAVSEIALSSNGGCVRRRGTTTSGELWCWGYVYMARWIDGASGTTPVPTRADDAGDAVAMASGSNFWCAARPDGSVQCMGMDANGQLGNGEPRTDSEVPVVALGFP